MGAGYAIKAKADQSAEILIYEDVGAGWFGGVTAKQFADDLKALGAVNHIDVRINSYGGDVFEGLAIYQQLVRHKATVTTHVDGVAASIASVIAMAGSEIRIAEAGWMMIHDAWGLAIGNAAEMRRQADLLDGVTGQIAGVYEARSGKPMAELRAWMADERWFNAADAIDAGLATVMAENLRIAAHAAPSERFKFRHLPGALSARTPAQTTAPAVSDADEALVAQVQAQAAALRARRAARATTVPPTRGAA